MKRKKGDTLIEVTIAVGLFSMIAIAIVSVMSSGTSSAQTALEVTLAREEIDAQAEALRFIQTAYIADKDSTDKRFTKLWEYITNNAIELGDTDTAVAPVLQFSPTTCSSLYDDSETSGLYSQKAFVINHRLLGNFTSEDDANDPTSYKNVATFYRNTDKKFSQAMTYPRLIFGIDVDDEEDSSLSSSSSETNLYQAEGIYIVAVKDSDTTTVVDGDSPTPGTTAPTAAFYDFYIRTCWYGTDAKRPSTISTVIRLYDPDAV